MPSNRKEEKYISLLEAARIYGCTQKHMALMAREKKLRAIKLGRNWLTTIDWLKEYNKAIEENNKKRQVEKAPVKKVIFTSQVKSVFRKAVAVSLVSLLIFAFISTAYIAAKEGSLSLASFEQIIDKLNNLDFQSSNFASIRAFNFVRPLYEKHLASVFDNLKPIYQPVYSRVIKPVAIDISNTVRTVIRGYNKTKQDVFAFIDNLFTKSGNFVINFISNTSRGIVKGPSSFGRFVVNVFQDLPQSLKKFFTLEPFAFGFPTPDISEQSFITIKDLYKKLSKLRKELGEIERGEIIIPEPGDIIQHITIVKKIEGLDQETLDELKTSILAEVDVKISAIEITDFESMTFHHDSLWANIGSFSTALGVGGFFSAVGPVTLGDGSEEVIVNATNWDVDDNGNITTGGDISLATLTASGDITASGNITGSSTLAISGQATFTGAPSGTAVSEGSVYINPSTASSSYTLFGIAVGGTEKLRLDAEGDLTITGSLTAASTSFDVIDATTLSLDKIPTITSDPVLLMQPTNVSGSWATGSATFLGINASSSFAGNFADFRIDNTSKFFIDEAGNLGAAGVGQFGGIATLSYSRFGTGTTSRGLSASDDLLVSGNLEVDGESWFDGTVNFINIASSTLFYAQDGTVTSPSYTFSSDTNTGLYREGDDSLSFVTAGVRRLNIASDGALTIDAVASHSAEGDWAFDTDTLYIESGTNRVGIGTTSPGAELEVSSGSNYVRIDPTGTSGVISSDTYLKLESTTDYIILETGGSGYMYFDAGGVFYWRDEDASNNIVASLGSSTGNLQLDGTLSVDGSGDSYIMGNVGIGDTSPGAKFEIVASTSVDDYYLMITEEDSTDGGILTIASTGYVGIGTTSPTYELDVVGNIGINEYLYHNDDADTYIRFIADRLLVEVGNREIFEVMELDTDSYVEWNHEAEDIDFFIQGDTDTSLFYLDANEDAVGIGYGKTDLSGTTGKLLIDGNVGIGTTSPGANLDIEGATAFVNVESTTGTNHAYQDFINTGGIFRIGKESSAGDTLITAGAGATAYAGILSNVGAYPLQFGTSNTVRMTILSDGNVGIGTTSPGGELSFGVGDVKIQIESTDGSDTGAILLQSASSSTSSRGAFFGAYGADHATFPGRVTISGGAGGDIWFLAQPASTAMERMRITSAGNVGINDVSPGALLEIQDNDTETELFAISSSSVGDYFIVKNTGNVGIGTGNPSYKLDVSAGAASVPARFVGTNTNSYLTITGSGGTGYFGVASTNTFIQSTSNGSVSIWDDTAARLTVKDGGNVGIGTTSPTTKLQVAGSGIFDNELIVGEALQVGGTTSISYSRFGVTGATHTSDILTSDDLMISGDLEVDGQAWFDSNVSISQNLEVGGAIYGDLIGNITITGFNEGSVIFAGPGGELSEDNANFFWDDTSDNLGISDITPDAKFEIVASASVDDYYLMITEEDQADGSILTIASTGYVGIGTTGPSANLEIEQTSSGYAPEFIKLHNLGGAIGTGGEIAFYVGTDIKKVALRQTIVSGGAGEFGIYTGGSGTTLGFHQDEAGKVGIGTTSPNSLLDVAGNILASSSANVDLTLRSSSATGEDGKFTIRSAGSNDRLDILNNTTELLTIASTGHVGIGTTNPLHKLHVKGDADGIIMRLDGGDLTSEYLSFYVESGITSIVAGYTGSGDNALAFKTSATTEGERMRIDKDGNVGIGDTSPDAKFDVAGSGIFDNELIVGEALTVGYTTSAAYSQFGSGAMDHGLDAADDVLIAGDLEVDGQAWFESTASVSGKFEALADITLGDADTDLLVVNADIASNLIPNDNTRYVGDANSRWAFGYFDELNVTSMSAEGTTISGTKAETFTINSDNATEDTEDAWLAFERGNPETNASIKWDSTNDRFDMNFPLIVSKSIDITGTLKVDSYVGIGTSPDSNYLLSVAGDVYLQETTYLGTTSTYFNTSGDLQMGGGAISDSSDEVDIDDSLAINSYLQVGGTAATTYSRFGTGTSNHGLDGANDLLISGNLEVDNGSNVWFDSFVSISNNFEIGSDKFKVTSSTGNTNIAGNLTISGTFTADTAASHSFTGDLSIADDLEVDGTVKINTLSGVLKASSGTISGLANLDDINDVVITSVADNELLAYDSGGNWINQTASEAGVEPTVSWANLAIGGSPLTITGGTNAVAVATAITFNYDSTIFSLSGNDLTIASASYWELTYDWKVASESFYDEAYQQRGSQIAGTNLTWDGSELDWSATESDLETILGIDFGTNKTATNEYFLIGDNTDWESTASSSVLTLLELDNVLKADGSVDLTSDWTIANNNITLTAGTLTANHLAGTTASVSGKFEVLGNTTLGDASTDLLVVNADIASNLIPNDGTRYVGDSGNRWYHGYFDNLNVTSMSAEGTTISGTKNETFTINSDNATNDEEDANLAFSRGNLSPDALLKWDSTNDRFDMNFPLTVQGYIYGQDELIIANQAQFGGTSTESYSRFGTGTADYLSGDAHDLLISDELEVDGQAWFDSTVSISSNFEVTGLTTLNGGLTTAAGQSLTLNGNLLAFPADTTYLQVSGNQLTFASDYQTGAGYDSRFVNVTGDTMTGALILNSVNELIVGGALQTGGTTSVSYSRFGTTGATYTSDILTSDDLMISGDLEVDGQAWFDANASVSGNFEVSGTIYGDGSGLFGVSADPAGNDGQIQYNNDGVTGGATQFYYNDSTHRVGIGDSSPEVTFEVVGSASISGTFDLYGTFTANTAASHSFAGDLDIGDDLTVTGDLSYGNLVNTIDISSNTNLAVSDPISLSDDTIGLYYDSNDFTLSGSDLKIASASYWELTYDWKVASESFYDEAYQERGSQIAGTNLTWDGTELDVDDPFTVTQLNFTNASGSGTFEMGSDKFRIIGSSGDTTIAGTLDPANVAAFTLTGQQTLGGTYYIDNNGDSYFRYMGIGTAPGATYPLQVADDAYLQETTYLGTTSTYFNTSGDLQMGGGAISDSSDEVDIDDSLAINSYLQVGGTAATTYSRFGLTTDSSNHSLSGATSVLVAGDLEINGTLYTDGGIVGDGTFDCVDCINWDDIADSMTLDANLTVASASYNTTWNGDFHFMQGNVGIGTTNPIVPLHVEGEIEADSFAIDSTSTYGIWFKDDATGSIATDNQAGSEISIYDRYNSVAIATFEEGGNVGIGTTTPIAGLEISTEKGNTAYASRSYQDNHDMAFYIPTGANDYFTQTRYYSSGAPHQAEMFFGVVREGSYDSSFFFKGYTAATGYHEMMRIDASGNIGINNDSPAALLEIQDNDSETELFAISSSSVGDLFIMKNTGKVGIGTTSPEVPLHIYHATLNNVLRIESGDSAAGIEFEDNSTTNRSAVYAAGDVLTFVADTYLQLELGGGTTIFNNESQDIDFRIESDNSANALFVEGSSGNVGIGTTSPAVNLHVHDTSQAAQYITVDGSNDAYLFFGHDYDGTADYAGIKFDASDDVLMLFNANSATNHLIIDNTGNVGIGTTSPGGTLDVAGEIRFTADDTFASDVAQLYTHATHGLAISGHAGTEYDFMVCEGGGNKLISNPVGTNNILLAEDTGGYVGIGTTGPDGTLHVHTATAGTWAPPSYGDDLIVENSATGGISIATPDASEGYLVFSSPSNTGDYNAFIGATYNAGDEFLRLGVQGESTAMYIYSDELVINEASHDYDFRVESDNSANALFVQGSDGNVGIGTTGPLTLLHLRHSTFPILRLDGLGNNLDDNPYGSIEFYNRDVSGAGPQVAAKIEVRTMDTGSDYGRGGQLAFYTATGIGAEGADPLEAMRIDSNGNVGIGTTSPDGLLNVAKAAASSGIFFDVYSTTNAESAYLMLRKSDHATLGTKSQTDDGDLLGMVSFQGVDTGSGFGYGAAITATQEGVAGADYVPTQMNLYTFSDSGSNAPQLVLAPDGNVGIGTTSPGDLLHVYSTDSWKPVVRIENDKDDASGPYLMLLNSKNSGATASVVDDTLGLIYAGGSEGGGEEGVEKAIGFYADGTWATNDRPTRINFWTTADGSTTDSIRMTIKNSGNVGIGDTSPDAMLEIDDNDSSSMLFAITSSSDGDYFVVKNDGKVGIGTTGPEAKLEIYDSDVDLSGQIYPAGNLLIYTSDALAIGKGGSIGLGGRYHTSGWRTFGLIKGAKETDVVGNQLGYLGFYVSNNSAYLVEKVRITSAGNVGIGVAGPQSKLHIWGTMSSGNEAALSITNDGGSPDQEYRMQVGIPGVEHQSFSLYDVTNSQHRIVVKSDGNVGINDNSPGALLEIQDNDTETELFAISSASVGDLFVMKNTGRVGIGTGAPDYTLDVAGNMGIDTVIYHNDDTNTYMQMTNDNINFYADGIRLLDLAESTQDAVIINENSADIDFRVESNTDTHALFVQGSDGNVGIGTTGPGALLDIAANSTDAVRIGADNATSLARTDSTTKSSAITMIHYDTDEEDFGLFVLSSTNTANTLGIGGGTSSYNAATDLAFYTAANYNTLTGTERMRIDSSGNVGINDTSPDAKFEIVASTSVDDYYLMITEEDSTDGGILTIASTGYVGIGTTSPATPLHVNGSGGTGDASGTHAVGIFNSSYTSANIKVTSTTGTTHLGVDGSGGSFIGSLTGAYPLRMFAGADEIVRLHSSGGVAIGDDYVGTDPGVDNMIIEGNVGIGTTSPATLLDIEDLLTGTGGSHADQPVLRLTQGADTTYDIGDIHSEIQFYTLDPGGSFPGIQAYIRAITTRGSVSNPDTGLIFGTSNDSGGLAIDRMVIDHQGYVGIGNTAPALSLEVGNITSLGVDAANGVGIQGDLEVEDFALLGALRVGSTGTDPGGGNAYLEGNLTVAGENINSASFIDSKANATMPHLILDSRSDGDNWTSQGAYISLGESGGLGDAALHMTYTGDGYGFIGSGTVTSGIPGASYLRFDYDSNNIYTPDTITAGDFECTDCIDAGDIGADAITNSELGANSVDLTSQALSTAYAGVGIGGGGASALSFAAADVDGTCLTGSGTTLDITTTGCKTNWDLAYDHISATGASHTYINQSVTTGSSPTFANATISTNLTTPKLTIGSYYLNSLIANNKVPDSDKWDGYQFADYLNQAVKTTSNVDFNQVDVTDYLTASGGIHVGGTSDPGTDNLVVDGNATVSGRLVVTNTPIIEAGAAGVTRVFRNLANFEGNTSADLGAIVINTGIASPVSAMSIVHLRGYEYSSTVGPGNVIDLDIASYFNGPTWTNRSYVNHGSVIPTAVQIGTNSTGQIVIVIGSITDSWSYPKLWIESWFQSHTSQADSTADNWSISLVTDLTGYTLAAVGHEGLSLQGGTIAGTLNMQNNLITNIGNANTDFTSGGGLAIAGTLDPNGAITLPTTGISGAGSGSGLDADKWDSYQFADYLNQAVKTTSSPTFAGLTMDGNLNMNSQDILNIGVLGTDPYIYNSIQGSTSATSRTVGALNINLWGGDVNMGDNNEIYIDTSANSVGIGTTTVTDNKLVVQGGITTSDGTDQGKIHFRHDRDDCRIAEGAHILEIECASGILLDMDSNANGGTLSFHKGATEVGSLTDGGTLQIDGNLTVSGGNIYNLSTNNRWQAASSSNTFYTQYGNIQLGPMNTSWAHIYTDIAGGFYFDKAISAATLTSRGNAAVGGELTMNDTAIRNIQLASGTSGTDLCLGNGDYNTGDIVACSGSSIRFKENIQDLEIGLNEVMQLRPVSFDFKKDYLEAPRQFGFIGEEVASVSTLLADYRDGLIYGVQYKEMTALLAKGIQEQQEQIEEIKTYLGLNIASSSGTVEDNITITSSTSPIVFLENLVNGLKELGVSIKDGIITAVKLVVDEVKTKILRANTISIIVEPDQDNVVGSATIPRDSMEYQVENSLVEENSKIFISFTSNTAGRTWYVSEKILGVGFTIKLSEVTTKPLDFDYWIVLIEETGISEDQGEDSGDQDIEEPIVPETLPLQPSSEGEGQAETAEEAPSGAKEEEPPLESSSEDLTGQAIVEESVEETASDSESLEETVPVEEEIIEPVVEEPIEAEPIIEETPSETPASGSESEL